jgi:hypothetical protein
MKKIRATDVGSVLRLLRPNRDFDIGAEHEFRVFYPSGKEFSVRGRLALIEVLPPNLSPAIKNESEVFLLDPRAIVVVFDPQPILCYAPTATQARVEPELLDWLAEHPEWPGTLFARKGWAIDMNRDGA